VEYKHLLINRFLKYKQYCILGLSFSHFVWSISQFRHFALAHNWTKLFHSNKKDSTYKSTYLCFKVVIDGFVVHLPFLSCCCSSKPCCCFHPLLHLFSIVLYQSHKKINQNIYPCQLVWLIINYPCNISHDSNIAQIKIYDCLKCKLQQTT